MQQQLEEIIPSAKSSSKSTQPGMHAQRQQQQQQPDPPAFGEPHPPHCIAQGTAMPAIPGLQPSEQQTPELVG